MLSRLRVLILAGATLLPAVLSAAGLPRLPKDRPLPQGEGSPGPVVFRHETHVDASRPDCTVCHPSLFPILKRAQGKSGPPIRHSRMEKGLACGACHDGTSAFKVDDDCAACHHPG